MHKMHAATYYFDHCTDGTYICLKARGGIYELYKELLAQFPNEKVEYHCGRETSYGPNGGRSRVNKKPRERSLTIKFTDPANEAFFIMKYIGK